MCCKGQFPLHAVRHVACRNIKKKQCLLCTSILRAYGMALVQRYIILTVVLLVQLMSLCCHFMLWLGDSHLESMAYSLITGNVQQTSDMRCRMQWKLQKSSIQIPHNPMTSLVLVLASLNVCVHFVFFQFLLMT